MYGEMEMGGNPQANGHELSASTFSSPLYSEDTSVEHRYTENGALMNIIRMQSAKAKRDQNVSGVGGEPAEAISYGAAAAPKTAEMSVEPYEEAVTFGGGDSGAGNNCDDQDVYDLVEAPSTPNFDNPDYEAI